MDYTTLGKTGLKVSVAGLGMGGNSRLGQNTGRTEDESIRIVKLAMDMGVNFFDTAKVYGTEAILGKALQGTDRDSLVVATKATIWHGDEPKKGAAIIRDLEESLKTLRMEYVDLFQLHAVPPERYDQVMEDIAPSLQQAKRDGKIRHMGISESAPVDPAHTMLERAVNEAHADDQRQPL